MFPSLRFTIASVIVASIVFVVASVPFVSFRLMQRGLPPTSDRPHMPHSIVGSGAGSFDARFTHAAASGSAPVGVASPDLVIRYRDSTAPTGKVVSAMPPPAQVKVVAETDITASVEPAKKAIPAATNAVIELVVPAEIPPALEKKEATAPEHSAAVMPADAPATVPATAPAAVEPQPTPDQTAAVTPTAPDAKTAAQPAVKKRARSRRAQGKRGRTSRGDGKTTPLLPFSLFFRSNR